MRKHFPAGFLTALTMVATSGSCAEPTPAPGLRMNEIQVIGSHNSYHTGVSHGEMAFYRKLHLPFIDELDYRHPSLTQQLENGVRQLELDVYADPQGGLFSDPKGRHWASDAGFTVPAHFDPQHIMDKPGFKVFHIQDVDYRSSCQPFVGCLHEIKAWSDANPAHVPLFILVEAKDSPLPSDRKTTTPVPFTRSVFDALDAAIRSVFPDGELLTPDDVRGNTPSLRAALLSHGWPLLDAVRGKIIFLLDQRKQERIYTDGHPSLEGRVMFTNAVPGRADAAFTEVNNGPSDMIATLVRENYLVRTRADDGLVEARANDGSRRDRLEASGAQIISTDFSPG